MHHFEYDPDGQLSLGQPAPDFTLPNVVDGKSVSLADFRGAARGAVVIFSCNHCPHVITNEERLIALGAEYQSQGVPFFVISSNDVVKYPQDGPLPMKERASQKGYPFPYLFDETQEIARIYGAQVTPHIFVFDANFKLRYRGAIDDNPDREDRATREFLRDAIEAVILGRGAELAQPATRALGCSVKWK